VTARQIPEPSVEVALAAYRDQWEEAQREVRGQLAPAAEQPAVAGKAASTIGDGSPNGPDGPGSRRCPICGSQVPSSRARFCSGTCRQTAWRWRHAAPAVESVRLRPPTLRPKVYECPECEQRYLDERRCPDCNLFCRLLGHGGPCPSCDELLVVADLLGEASL
jgi:hypothetical protein